MYILQKIDGIEMSRSHCLENLLQTLGMADSKTRSTPCEQNPSVFIKSDEIPEESSRKYREIVGSLIYATTCKIPNLSWVVTKLS